MPWKDLTAITEIEARELATELVLTYHLTRQQSAVILAEREHKHVLQYPPLRYLDVAGMLHGWQIRQWVQVLPALRAPEAPRRIPLIMTPDYTEEALIKRLPEPQRKEAMLTYQRFVETEPQKRLAEIERLKLDKRAILCTDNLIQAMLEKLLILERPLETQQALQTLIEAVEARQRFIRPVLGIESLQKLLMTYYIPFYMEMPYRHNMFGLVLSFMTYQATEGKQAGIYASLSGQGQAIKQKAELISCEKRVERTKALASLKKTTEWWQTINALAEISSLNKKELVPLLFDMWGKPLVTVTLFQAMGMRYLISSYFARQMGIPENKYWLVFPRLEIIITRRGVRIRRLTRIPFWRKITFRRDEYLRNWRKWRGFHG